LCHLQQRVGQLEVLQQLVAHVAHEVGPWVGGLVQPANKSHSISHRPMLLHQQEKAIKTYPPVTEAHQPKRA
jgi:hypothetical protein